EACGELVERHAPEVAPHGGAGVWDQRARFMALRLRQLHTRPCEDDDGCAEPIAQHLAHLRELLESELWGPDRLAAVALFDDVEAAASWLPDRVAVPRFADELVGDGGEAAFLPA